MGKEYLAERLLKLSYEMLDVATHLDYFGGFNETWRDRAAQLSCACAITKNWGREMLDDSK